MNERLERIRVRYAIQVAWLHEHHPEVFSEQGHLTHDSPERTYWHYGYMVALRDALSLLGVRLKDAAEPQEKQF